MAFILNRTQLLRCLSTRISMLQNDVAKRPLNIRGFCSKFSALTMGRGASRSSVFQSVNNNNNQTTTILIFRRQFSAPRMKYRNAEDKNRSMMMTVTAIVIMVLGLSYAAVPLYRIYCQKTKKGGQAVVDDEINEKVLAMEKVDDRKIAVRFEAEKSARLAWDFKPSQGQISCVPGETVLAFYTAKNQLDRVVNGIATYTILPYEAGKYFNKIQCFCFEEQQLNPNEEVDLPVFFYIDPEFSKDPFLFEIDDIILSYNFFETKEGFKLPKQPAFRAHTPFSQPANSSSPEPLSQ